MGISLMSSNYECAVCALICTSQNDLQAHHEIQHKSVKYSYICELCGKTSRSIQGYLAHHIQIHQLNKKQVYDEFHLKSTDLCCICGASTKWAPPRINKWGYDNYCPIHRKERTLLLRQETCRNKYGVDNVRQNHSVDSKIKDTCLNKYGTTNVQELDWVKAKIKDTCLNKYGTTNVQELDWVKAKTRDTNQKLYGVDNGSQSLITKESMAILGDRTRLSAHYDTALSCTQMAGDLDVSVSTVCNYMQQHDIPYSTKSAEEESIATYLDTLDVEYIRSDRKQIGPQELDFYIPRYELAIEYNGVYWHSELRGKKSSYHLSKTRACSRQGIQLLHIFSTDNIPLWRSVISNKLGICERIYARKCRFSEISSQEADRFCQSNHLQGRFSAKYNYGLYYQEELISVMTFSKSRYNFLAEFEMIRYCCKVGVQVIGGASKLLKNSLLISVLSYANRRWSDGSLYRALGFRLHSETRPNYFYTSDYKSLSSRLKFQKHKLTDLSTFDANLSEWENMKLQGYDRIWDCGNLLYVLST